MKQIVINSELHSLLEVDDRWISDQVKRRQAENQIVCVKFNIDIPGASVHLATPTCAGGAGSGGGGRAPNAMEQAIFNEWNKRQLNSERFDAEAVVSFARFVRGLGDN